jgi:hypothetical protein
MTSTKLLSALVALAVFGVGLGSVVGSAQDAEDKPGLAGAIVTYTYRFESTQSTDVPLQEELTVVMTPLIGNRYQVVTTVTSLSSADEASSGFFGASLQWLGFYMSEEGEPTAGRLNLSGLISLGALDLQPNSSYMLPDGGWLATHGEVDVHGVAGIEGRYFPNEVSTAVITVVMAKDPWLRRFLPFPVSLRIERGATTPGEAAPGSGIGFIPQYFTGSMVLTGYHYTPPSPTTP